MKKNLNAAIHNNKLLTTNPLWRFKDAAVQRRLHKPAAGKKNINFVSVS